MMKSRRSYLTPFCGHAAASPLRGNHAAMALFLMKLPSGLLMGFALITLAREQPEGEAQARGSAFYLTLDGAAAAVPNAKLSQVACDSQEIESLETKQPA